MADGLHDSGEFVARNSSIIDRYASTNDEDIGSTNRRVGDPDSHVGGPEQLRFRYGIADETTAAKNERFQGSNSK